MKERVVTPRPSPSSEPVGIVISRGRETEATPVFAAYMYAPAPDDALDAMPVLAGT